jgi:hypothetical protein
MLADVADLDDLGDLPDTEVKECPKCFVIMPVSTPLSYADDFKDTEHFAHVLAHLLEPALVRAGYDVIPPTMFGSALIHAEIIRHLETADLVLADLSSGNPNVYFELGVRTSLDRPVVLIKDHRTPSLPFDVGPINVLTYDESLTPWTLEKEIESLANHIGKVEVGSGSGNDMWKYFGLTKRGKPGEAGPLDAKVDLLISEVAQLRLSPLAEARVGGESGRALPEPSAIGVSEPVSVDALTARGRASFARELTTQVNSAEFHPIAIVEALGNEYVGHKYILFVDQPPTEGLRKVVRGIMDLYGISLYEIIAITSDTAHALNGRSAYTFPDLERCHKWETVRDQYLEDAGSTELRKEIR